MVLNRWLNQTGCKPGELSMPESITKDIFFIFIKKIKSSSLFSFLIIKSLFTLYIMFAYKKFFSELENFFNAM